MRTTIDISDAVLRDLRQLAARSNRPLRVVVEETLQRGLAQSSGGGRKHKVRIKPHPVGIKPAFRGLSMNQLYDQIEAEESIRKS